MVKGAEIIFFFISVEFVVDKLELLQISVQVLWSSPVGVIPPVFRTHAVFICLRRYIILAIDGVLE